MMSDILKEKNIELKISDKQLYLEASITSSDDFLDRIASALSGGVDIVELSGDNVSDSKFLEIANNVKFLCAQFDATFIVKSRADIAYITTSDGIFLDENSLDKKYVREILGENTIIGTSTIESDYIKISIASINSVTNAIRPVFVCGGITPETCKKFVQLGYKRICVSREILDSQSPKTSAQELKTILLSS